MLLSLVNFYVRNGLEPKSGSSNVLNQIIFARHSNREFFHEAIRQSLLLPFQYNEVSRGAIHIIRSWTLCYEDQRPFFLQDAFAERKDEHINANKGSIINTHLRRYISILKATFFEKADRSSFELQQVYACFFY